MIETPDKPSVRRVNVVFDTTLDALDQWKGAATGASAGHSRRAVANAVADQRHRTIVEARADHRAVGEQFEDAVVGAVMQVAGGALDDVAGHLGVAVPVEHLRAEASLDGGALEIEERFARRENSLWFVTAEQVQRRRIAMNEIGPVSLEGLDVRRHVVRCEVIRRAQQTFLIAVPPPE